MRYRINFDYLVYDEDEDKNIWTDGHVYCNGIDDMQTWLNRWDDSEIRIVSIEQI